jgi:hypothetical protein
MGDGDWIKRQTAPYDKCRNKQVVNNQAVVACQKRGGWSDGADCDGARKYARLGGTDATLYAC